MNTFRQSLTREFTANGVSVISVLIAIIVTHQLIMFLGRAASGAIEPEAVVAMIGFMLIAYLPVLLALALFVAVLIALTRSYRDSEMPVWFSSGLSLMAWVNPVLRFGVPIALVTALLSTVLTPWAFRESAEYQRLLRSKDDVARISPGSFVEARGANRVFFVDNTSADASAVNNVFVQYNQNNRFGVVVAEKGRTEIAENGEKFLVLYNCRRYEGTPGALDFRMIDFQTQKLRIEAKEEAAEAPSNKQISTLEILRNPNPERWAELHWRIALPIAALVLSLMAIPLSFINPRSGTSWNGVFAIIVFFLYYNTLSIFQGWTAQGVIPVWVGLTPVHLGMVLLLAIMFSKHLLGFGWLAFARK
ncbi:MAG: LPS export ABC transporter permease LptF [Burkholderiales bacterium]